MPRMYTIEFKSESGRFHSVTGTDMCLQDLCMGPHVRQRQQHEANKERLAQGFKTLPIDEPRANGELKGCTLRYERVRPPFSLQKSKDAA